MKGEEIRTEWRKKTKAWKECKKELLKAKLLRKRVVAEAERVEAVMREEAFNKRNRMLEKEAGEDSETA